MVQRVIDVVFVHPKNRQLVVWHEGQWWQTTKMQLTENSWQYKKPYTGSLNEIYVAKDQALSCEHLTKTLKTHELPAELRGISATKFLLWWSMHDFDWLNRRNVVELHTQLHTEQSTKALDTTPVGDTTSVAISPAADTATVVTTTTATLAKSATEKPINGQAITPQPQPQSQPSSAKQTANNHITNEPSINPTKPNTEPPSPEQTQTASPKTKQSQSAPVQEMDVFDSLLHELNEEVLHQK